ncbi:MAG: insulinase family protein [Gemmatimonadetes bacterium]|nr:insulinase family protein [Gemmatimonadota bacterium]
MTWQNSWRAGALVLVIALAATPANALTVKEKIRNLSFEPIEVTKQTPHRETLPNGVRIFTLEDHRLPLVDMVVIVKAGSLYEPADRSGLASLTGTLLRTGGTESMHFTEVDEKADAIAARFSTWIGTESGGAYLNVHVDRLEDGVGLVADALRRPAFDPERFGVEMAQLREQIRRQNDNVQQIGRREFRKILYGEGHPAARFPTNESLDRITRDDLVAFHDRYFVPNEVWIAFAGAITPGRARTLVEAAFGDWESRSVTYPEVPAVDGNRSPEIVHIQKESDQSIVSLGHLSIRRTDDDWALMRLANHVLGGSFSTSRLITEIRHKRGLAYATGSMFRSPYLYDGVFAAYAGTKGESTGEVLGILLDEVKKMDESGVSADELEIARNALVNQEVFEYESAQNIVQRLVDIDFYGLPDDHYEAPFTVYQSADRKTLNEAIARDLNADGLKILVVGDEAKFDVPLEDFGYPVRRVTLD